MIKTIIINYIKNLILEKNKDHLQDLINIRINKLLNKIIHKITPHHIMISLKYLFNLIVDK
jgi:hypothetical protein